MNNYIERLREELNLNNYSVEYENLCIEYAERLIINNLPVIFDKEHLSLLLGIEEKYLNKLFIIPHRFYKTYKLKKKKNGFRIISIPNVRLKCIQRWILDNIIYNIPVSNIATGFVKEKSILTNAKQHVNKSLVITMDIENFFPSISFERVYNIFYYYGYTKEVAYILSRICTLNNQLPQGAPTSPYLANIICKKMDKRINQLCRKINASFTRYADDITISGDKNIIEYIGLISKIIEEEGFRINSLKTRAMYQNRKQMVTGLIVNNKISVPKEKIRKLRQDIYYIKKYGVTDHNKKRKCKCKNIKEHLYGLAYFIEMVDSDKGKKYIEELNKINWDT